MTTIFIMTICTCHINNDNLSSCDLGILISSNPLHFIAYSTSNQGS